MATRKSIKEWLADIGLDKYEDAFVVNGWDSMLAFSLLTEKDVQDIVPLEGHRRILNSALHKLARQEQSSSSLSPHVEQPSNPTRVSKKPSSTGESCGYKKLTVWYKNPKYPRLQYSNQILPDIYKSAYGIIPNFEEYFRKESTERWYRMQKLNKIRKKLEFYSDQNPAAYGQFTTIPTPPQPNHVNHINNGLKKLDDLKDDLNSESQAIKESYGKLFGPAGLRRWANEQNVYCESTVSEISTLLNNVCSLSNNICDTLKKIKSTLIGLRVTDESSKHKRAKKENRRKSKMRKIVRAEDAAEEVVSSITSGKEHFFPEMLLTDTDVVENILELHINHKKPSSSQRFSYSLPEYY